MTTYANYDYNEYKNKKIKDRIILRGLLIIKKNECVKVGSGAKSEFLAIFFKILVAQYHTSSTTDISIWKQLPQSRIRNIR